MCRRKEAPCFLFQHWMEILVPIFTCSLGLREGNRTFSYLSNILSAAVLIQDVLLHPNL